MELGPKHIAVVMDGNGRWAQERSLSRFLGHEKGIEAVERIISGCVHHLVPYLTLFAFSTENWRRSSHEVKALFSLLVRAVSERITLLKERGIRLCFVGSRSSLNDYPDVLQAMDRAEKETQEGEKLQVNVALNYGGRWDIVQAVKNFLRDSPGVSPQDISEELLRPYFCLAHLPDPDLFIRTSGEYRISNFFLWQLAYTELYFTPVFWPDFDEKILFDAILFFRQRQRRFGAVQNSFPN